MLFGREQALKNKSRLQEAVADYQRAADLCAQQLQANQGNISLLKILWPAQAGLGQLSGGQGNATDAVRGHRGALKTIGELIKADPETVGWQYDLLQERVCLSQVLVQRREDSSAAT